MNKYLSLLREVKSVSMATVDSDGNPQVRIIDVMLVKEDRLIFCTARGKDFYEQLITSKKISMVGLTKDYKMIKLSGDVCNMGKDKKIIDEIFDNNKMMNDIYKGDARYVLEGFYVEDGYIEYFDLSNHPIKRESTAIGKCRNESKIFKINDKCIACGTCAQACPQSCIDEGDIFKINQSQCLRCGYCFENCPVDAIERTTL